MRWWDLLSGIQHMVEAGCLGNLFIQSLDSYKCWNFSCPAGVPPELRERGEPPSVLGHRLM